MDLFNGGHSLIKALSVQEIEKLFLKYMEKQNNPIIFEFETYSK